jgi:hypothetical protein
LPPSALIELAARAGVDVIALTDHDTVAGLEEAGRSAAMHGLRLIPGVEISTAWRAQELHVLGLWIDPSEAGLLLSLDAQLERRRARLRQMCTRLDKIGLPGAALEAQVKSRSVLPTRLHLALAMVEAGIVSDADDAFRRYLGSGKRAYVRAAWPGLEEVIGWIRAAGGVAVLAHPARYALSGGTRRQMLADFAAAGGAALEVVTGRNGAQHAPHLAAMAVNLGLTGSVGSDFHNPELTWNPLGRSLKLPDCVTPVWRSYLP